MAYTPFVYYGSMSNTVGSQLFRVSAPDSVIVTSITLVNTDTVSRTVELTVDGYTLLSALPVPAGETMVVDVKIPIIVTSGYKEVDGWASASPAITYFISGVSL